MSEKEVYETNIYFNSIKASNSFDEWDNRFDDKHMLGDPTGEPYIVQIKEGHINRLSMVIHAQSETDAKERIIKGLNDSFISGYNESHMGKVFKMIENGCIYAKKANKGLLFICPWADNTTF